MTTEMEKFFKRETALEEKLNAAGLGYPMSKEDAVKAYKTMLVFRTDTPEMLDCELCFGVGHDFDAVLPCVLCCEPAKPVVDLMQKNAELLAERDQLKAENEALRKSLIEASEEIAAWGAYASEYFQQKHDLAGCVEKFHVAAMTKVQSHDH